MVVGVLALQGDFEAHADVLQRLGAVARQVRTPADLDGLDAIVLPGGESTTMTLGIEREGLAEPLRELAAAGTPVLATCAGMIVLDREHLGLVDVVVDRNAYGRQLASFEADLALEGDEEPLRGVFIRAPRVREAGEEVEVLAEHEGKPVLLRQGRFLAASFHPELTDDTRVHERFLDLVRQEAYVRS